MRPGCDRRATACLTYDADRSEVWLQDPRADDEPAQVVCSLHAESLTVPLGWTVTDRRSASLEVVDPLPTQEPASQAAPEPEPEPVPELELEPESDRGAELDGGPEPVAGGATLRRPKPKKNSLLDRAFEWTGPQHSVLTTRSPTAAEDDPAAGD
jgi:hypothetical protein